MVAVSPIGTPLMKGTARSSGGEGVLPNSHTSNPAAVPCPCTTEAQTRFPNPKPNWSPRARNPRVPRDVHPEADDDWLREVPALPAYERR